MDNPIEALYRQLARNGWSAAQLAHGIQAAFQCEYCDKNLLRTLDAYKEWQIDHIVPRFLGGGDSDANLAVACRTCNFIKGRWFDPRKSAASLDRGGLIEATRQYIRSERQRQGHMLGRVRELVQELLTHHQAPRST
jgi:HNH endonuclease